MLHIKKGKLVFTSNIKFQGKEENEMAMKNKVIVTAFLISFLVIGMGQRAQAYTFYIDQFSVTKNGSTLFTDPFNNGNPPPSAPDFVSGTPASYFMRGTMGPETNNPTVIPGKLTIDSSDAILQANAIGLSFLRQAALLLTDVSPGSTLGLRSGDTFSVTGKFDLVVPTSLRNGYGVFLTDSTATNDQEDYVEMSLVRNSLNQLLILLQHQDFVNGTETFVEAMALDTGHAGIALTLTKGNAGSNLITGSFAYIDGGVMGSPTTFANTTSIFGDEDFTRAGFEAFVLTEVPEPTTILLLGSGLIGLAGYGRKKFFKK